MKYRKRHRLQAFLGSYKDKIPSNSFMAKTAFANVLSVLYYPDYLIVLTVTRVKVSIPLQNGMPKDYITRSYTVLVTRTAR